MILGTPRSWWIITGICFLVGLVLIASGIAGTPGMVAGVFLILASMIVFAGAPMRYGERSRASKEQAAPQTPTVPAATPAPPRPRAHIEAGDASEV
jgi:drug/metabolite transporter (DMT)-like permease